MIEKLFWLSFFAMYWLMVILEVIEPSPPKVISLFLCLLCGMLATSDRHVQEGKKKQ